MRVQVPSRPPKKKLLTAETKGSITYILNRQMTEATIKHHDRIGRPIVVGDYVAFPSRNTLDIGQVTKLNAKMVKVERLNTKTRKAGYKPLSYNKYGTDCVVLDGPSLTLYLLKTSNG